MFNEGSSSNSHYLLGADMLNDDSDVQKLQSLLHQTIEENFTLKFIIVHQFISVVNRI